MSEQIKIEIQDKVDSSIEAKLEGIASAARTGHDHIERLKQALLSVDSKAINALSLANARAQKALNDASLASARLATEQQRTSAASLVAAANQQKLQTAATRTATAQQSLSAAIQRTAAAQSAAQTSAARLATEQQRTAVQTANAAAAADRAALAALRLRDAHNRQGQATGGAAASLLSYARSAAAVAGVGLSGRAVTNLADAYTTLQNKLQIVSSSQEQVADLTERLFDVSNRTYAPIEASTTAFSRFDRALQQLGRSQEESLRLTETVNKMLFISGSNAGEAGAALLQLSQAFNKGKLDGDEFRTVMELMPDAADAIAKQLNVTRGELLKLAPQGKLTGETLANAFLAASKDIDEKFAKVIPTIGQSFTVLRNNAIKAFGEFDKAIGITAGLSTVIGALANNMKGLLVAVTTVGAALLVYFGPALLAGVLSATKAVTAFTVAIARNPLGLLAVALASVITYFKVFNKEAEATPGIFDKIAFGLDAIAAVIRASVLFLMKFISQLVDTITNVIIKAFNAVKKFVQDTINFAIKAANYLREKVGLTAYEFVEFEKVKTVGSGEFKDIGQLWAESLEESFEQQASGGLQSLLENMRKNAMTKDSLLRPDGAPAKPTGGNPNEEKRSEVLRRINDELRLQAERMFALQPARNVQAQYDRIELDLKKKKIQLTSQESAKILEQLNYIEKSQRVQSAMDRIYEESTGALKDYNAVLDAQSLLLSKNAISQEDAARATLQAKEAYLNSVDPLRQINKELDQNIELLSMLPKERQIAQELQQIENQLLAQGRSLYDEHTGALKANGQALLERLKAQQEANIASQAEAAIWENTVGTREKYIADMEAIARLKKAGTITPQQALEQAEQANPFLETQGSQQKIDAELELLDYRQKQIEKLHQLEIISTENRNAAIRKLNADRFAVETQNAKAFFGGLAGLMNSSNAKLFKIGKAAALANAVIQGTQSVMNAMAIQPWYVGAALAVVAAAQAAQQIAQIKNAKPPQGYMKGGYTGAGRINEAAGIVHKREFVMNAAATSRIGVNNLEALQRGSAGLSSGNVNIGSPKITIKNYGTPQTYETESISREEIVMIARDESARMVARETSNIVSGELSNPSSKISKSIARNTNSERRR